jgi:steroid 5-alpha reductase family enzyme
MTNDVVCKFFVIALPIIYSVEKAPREMSPLVFLGVFLWLVGFFFESISDAQLKKFKAEPGNKGQIMTQGLWSWSRHPNYFGEVLQWWALFLMAVDLSSLWLIISPVAINFLILKVSGVPMLEELMEGRPGFQDYKKRTPIFFPWFPKK